jgi:hypothetical protein
MNKEEIKKLILNKERNSRITYFNESFWLQRLPRDISGRKKTKIRLRGLRPTLKEYCWKDYEYDAKVVKATRKRLKIVGGTGARFGSACEDRGKRVHREVEIFTNMPDDYERLVPEPHPYTVKFLRALTMHMYRPLYSEFKIFDEHAKIGTAIDLLCVDENPATEGRLVLVELKCGMDGYELVGNGCMQGPMSVINNCPLNQAFLQVMYASIILEMNYGIEPGLCIVAHVFKTGADLHPLPVEIEMLKDALHTHITSKMRSRHKTKKRKGGSVGASGSKKPRRVRRRRRSNKKK